MPPSEAWHLTLRELAAYSKGRARQAEIEIIRELYGAWHAAAFARMKKMPKLGDIMKRVLSRKTTAQTRDEALAAARNMVTAFGGKIVSRKKID